MSQIKIVIKKGNEKVSFIHHYSYPMNFVQGKAEFKDLNKQLDFLLREEKHNEFDDSPYDAGLIIFDCDRKIIDNRQNGGFGSISIDKFPRGWKFLEERGIINKSRWLKEKERYNRDDYGFYDEKY